MGHDVTAYKLGVNREQVRKDLRLSDYGDGWGERYEEYVRRTTVASISRSAFNPLNQVIYLALGVMDVYAGCSGDGSTLKITLKQFRDARQILDKKSFRGMERDPNLGDLVLAVLSATLPPGVPLTRGSAGNDGDVSQEGEFLDKCIEYLEKNGMNELQVSF